MGLYKNSVIFGTMPVSRLPSALQPEREICICGHVFKLKICEK